MNHLILQAEARKFFQDVYFSNTSKLFGATNCMFGATSTNNCISYVLW